MKDLTRRSFLRTLAFIGGLFGLKPAPSVSAGRLEVVQVQSVSAFYAPFMVDQLRFGRPLEIVWRWDFAMLALDGQLLGRLPAKAAEAVREATRIREPLKVRVDKTTVDGQGRLQLYVRLI